MANILVVDDIKNLRLTLAGILEDEGHSVTIVEDGYQAIEAVRKTHFDVVFMDIKMPGINGVEAFNEFKKIDPDTVVIMMTAYSTDDLVKRAVDDGAYTCIYKPFDITGVIELVGRITKEEVV